MFLGEKLCLMYEHFCCFFLSNCIDSLLIFNQRLFFLIYTASTGMNSRKRKKINRRNLLVNAFSLKISELVHFSSA